VRKLLEVLHRLTDLGNTVIIIEHNLDVVRNADWLIDLGPEGGEDGGQIVAEGTPEFVATVAHSHTGEFLRRYYTQTGGLPQETLPLPEVKSSSNGASHPLKAKPASTRAPRKRKAALVS
jgi:excinuclease ABC subunit A